MSLPGDFVSSLYLVPYTSKKWSMIIVKCDEAKLKHNCMDLPIKKITSVDLHHQ